MPESYEIRAFKAEDTPRLLQVWNRSLPIDGVGLSVFEQKVILDDNFSPEGLLVAETKDGVQGFIYGVVRRVPMPGLGLQEDKGWITAWGVVPEARGQGMGKALLNASLGFFKQENRKQVIFSTYSPNYFVPGVDMKAYAPAMQLLGKAGFEKVTEFLSMDARIVQYVRPDEVVAKEEKLRQSGIDVRFYERADLFNYLEFQRKHMPPDWLMLAKNNLRDLCRGMFEPDQIVIALDRGTIVGFCQHEAEHFGPFGVADSHQGKGIGTVLLSKVLERMHQKGLHGAWLLWTGDRAAQGVYGRLGFTETRRFAMMCKNI